MRRFNFPFRYQPPPPPPPPPPPENPPPLEKPELDDFGAGSELTKEPAIALVTEFMELETWCASNARPEYHVGA